MKNILVTGATGNIGRRLVSQLLARGDARVRAIVRNPDSARLPAGVEVVRGDLTVPESLDGCLNGIDAAFLMWQAPDTNVAATVERITKRAKRIVFLSNLNVRDGMEQQDNVISALHAKIERLIIASGGSSTFLRPGIFSSNAAFWWAAQIRASDVVRWPYADIRTSPIDERDIAAVALHALCEDGHAAAKYILTGPESLSFRDELRVIGEVIGRELRYEELTPEEARRDMVKIMPPMIADMLLNAFAVLAVTPQVITSAVMDITGSPAHSFHDWVVHNAAQFR
jgi:uncharacterized protein YbjT (DUF2867 family)